MAKFHKFTKAAQVRKSAVVSPEEEKAQIRQARALLHKRQNNARNNNKAAEHEQRNKFRVDRAETAQGQILRDKVGKPEYRSQGTPMGAAIYPKSKRPTNPKTPGQFASGKRAVQSGFERENPRVIPVSSMQVGRPLIGKRLF